MIKSFIISALLSIPSGPKVIANPAVPPKNTPSEVCESVVKEVDQKNHLNDKCIDYIVGGNHTDAVLAVIDSKEGLLYMLILLDPKDNIWYPAEMFIK